MSFELDNDFSISVTTRRGDEGEVLMKNITCVLREDPKTFRLKLIKVNIRNNHIISAYIVPSPSGKLTGGEGEGGQCWTE